MTGGQHYISNISFGVETHPDAVTESTMTSHVESKILHLTEGQITKLAGIATGAEVNVQANWNQTINTADDYIKNKPTIPTVPSNVLIYGTQTLTTTENTSTY